MLAWETSTNDGVVCVGRRGGTLASARFRTVKGHAGWLMPLIDSTVRGSGVDLHDIGAVASGIGPGGFTGVKVGVATANAMALALGVPLVGVPTLDLLAAHAPASAGRLLACIDARQGLLYAAAYETRGGVPERLTDYACVAPEEAGRLVAVTGASDITIVGFAPPALMEACERSGVSASFVDFDSAGFPAGGILASVAAAMMERGGAGDAFSVAPIYLRKPV